LKESTPERYDPDKAKEEITVSLFRRLATALALLALPFPNHADPAPTIHYAPAENLEHID
jgi:hypothetical protein